MWAYDDLNLTSQFKVQNAPWAAPSTPWLVSITPPSDWRKWLFALEHRSVGSVVAPFILDQEPKFWLWKHSHWLRRRTGPSLVENTPEQPIKKLQILFMRQKHQIFLVSEIEEWSCAVIMCFMWDSFRCYRYAKWSWRCVDIAINSHKPRFRHLCYSFQHWWIVLILLKGLEGKSEQVSLLSDISGNEKPLKRRNLCNKSFI